MADLRVNIAGVNFKNPVIAASGTFAFGEEYAAFLDVSALGGIALKALTPEVRPGNPPIRIAETPSGILNSVGLQNPGVDAFISGILPRIRRFDTVKIANVAGRTEEDYYTVIEKLNDTEIDMFELNVSCPNVKQGGVTFGTDPNSMAAIVAGAKARAKKPLIVKLTPNVTNIALMAKTAEDAGADAVSLVNTFTAMAINAKTRRPVLANVTGGLSGPAIKPIALRMVHEVYRAISIPIIGMGGIMTGEDAAEFLLAGASALMVGTATVAEPDAMIRILGELFQYADTSEIICKELAEKFEGEKIDVVVGPALGGVIMAYEMGRQLGVRNIFAERENGNMTLRRGFKVERGERVLVCEDVVTTGGSVKEVIALLSDMGAEIVGVGSVVDRSNGKVDFGVPFHAVLSMEVTSYEADNCPLCKEGKIPANKPGSRNLTK